MPGHIHSLFRRKLGGAPLPVAAFAALVAGSSTLMIWQSPGNLVAEVQPLIMDFGSSTNQSSSDQQSAVADTTSPGGSTGATSSDGGDVAPYRRSREPVRTQRSNGGLVLEWRQPKATKTGATDDTRTQAREVLKEAEDYLLVGDLRRALTSARLAYSYPVIWDDDEQSPEELLAKLEALASDPTFIASARRDAVNRINSANLANSEPDIKLSSDNKATTDSLRPGSIVDSMPDRQTTIGVWKPAPVHEVSFPSNEHPATGDVALAAQSENATNDNHSNIATVSATGVAASQSPDFPAFQPYQSQPTTPGVSNSEPGRLNVDSHRQVSESTAEFAAPAQFTPIQQLEPRPLIITDQRAAAASASPIGTLTFDVLATLTTIFAVLFFGALFVLLAVLAIGKKLIGEKGVAFRIELVNNSPLTIQAAGMAPVAASAGTQSVAADELKIDPDFEGILSLSEQRARQRESAILEQFIQNNVSLHNEIGASRAAA